MGWYKIIFGATSGVMVSSADWHTLFFYVIFEITQVALTSFVMASFTKFLHENGEEIATKGYQVNSSKAVSNLLNAWKFVFPVCALIGLAGGMILIAAIISSLHRL